MPALNFKNPDAQLLLAGAVVLVVVYFIGKSILSAGVNAAGAAASAAGGLVTGNNALTNGTEYQGTGVLGTLGAATNDASGGFFSWLGDKIGGGLADLTQPEAPTAATSVNAGGSTVQDGTWQ